MPSVFPGAIDSFTDPLTSSPLNSPSHAGQHQDLNDAVEKVEQYMGLVKVIPTGATNGTVGATGTVTIGNAVTSVTVSGAFSTLYENYLVLLSGGAASGNAAISLRLGATAAGYYQAGQSITYAAVSVAASVNNLAQFTYFGVGTSDSLNAHGTFIAPNLAKRTYMTTNYIFGNPAGGGDMAAYMGYVNNTTQYTDFTLIMGGSQTMTGGSIRVYGYRN
jgi:hypothetical protein